MKKFLAIACFLFSGATNGFSQTANSLVVDNKLTNKSLHSQLTNDSLPIVEITKITTKSPTPIYYVNGTRCNPTFLNTINPKNIDSITVVKRPQEIGGPNQNGEIHIRMKKGYHPNILSLDELKRKYATDVRKPTIFIIDNTIIEDDYANYLVDEKYILKIMIDTIKNEQEKIDIQVIRLLTRKDENIQQTNRIILRGNEN